MEQTLQMIFVNEAGSNVTISIQDPRADLTEQAVIDVMNMIIAKNVFISNGGALVSIGGARIVSRDVAPIIA